MVVKQLRRAILWRNFVFITLILLVIFIHRQLSSLNMRIVGVNSVNPRVVKVPDDFCSIQIAINKASDGDVIFVKAGVYQESIVLNKSIILLGESRDYTIIDSNKSSDVITVVSSDCEICGFTIRNGGLSLPANCGIKLCNVCNVSVINNAIADNFIGIKLGDKRRGCSANLIADNIISGNRYGIFLDHSSGNVIRGNCITKNFWNGIELAWSNGNKIYNNTICCNRAYGLEIPLSTPSRYNSIYHNNFINNTQSASASGCENTWDNDYPSGGNYWSDYGGVDNMFGVRQDLVGRDCIGDMPYVIDAHNIDNYPLTIPFAILNPVADFVFHPDVPKVGEPVIFNAFAVDRVQIANYTWDFGDGNTAYGQNVTHKYAYNGTFKVQLKVTNVRGFLINVTKSVAVHTSNEAWDGNININHMFLFVFFLIAFIFFSWYFLKSKHYFKNKNV